MTFEDMWKSLEEKDITGKYKQAREMADLNMEQLEYAYNSGYTDAKSKYERPQGKWINHRNDYGHNIADCSECGKTMQWHDEDEDGIPRYCWYCGARMRQ